MKHEILRRAGASVLVLALALTLSLGLIAPVWANAGDLSITVNGQSQTTLTLKPGGSAQLAAKWEDGKGPQSGDTEVKYSWTCSQDDVTFTSNNTEEASATTVKAGSKTVADATITLTVTWKDSTEGPDNGKTETAACTLTVSADSTSSESPDVTESPSTSPDVTESAPPAGPSLSFAPGELTWSNNDPANWTITVNAIGINDVENIEWSIDYQLGESGSGTTVPPDCVGNGTQFTISSAGKTPGKFTVKAAYGGVTATKDITISGIVLVPAKSLADDGTLKLYVNESTTFSAKLYGLADGGPGAQVKWGSSDGSVASVMNGGVVTARGLGRTTITAQVTNTTTHANYTAEYAVQVVEDESVIAGPYTASVSKPLNIGKEVYAELNRICNNKTADYGTGEICDLSYITNVKVAFTSQGTLYLNYVSEGNTGPGPTAADRFAKPARSGMRNADTLYFVPKPGFTGTAEITFMGMATNGYNFSGTIKVNVGVGSENEDGTFDEYEYQISYRTRAGEPAWFLASDFNAFCQNESGRGYNYIMFSLPKSSEGTLYYNYMAGSGNPVTTTMQFTQNGTYTINGVCFVPNEAFADETVTINFRAVDTAGTTVNGKVTVEVIPADVAGDTSSVSISGDRDQPVSLPGELFSDACRDTINDTLSFVIFKQLPSPSDGVLFYNYQSNGSYESRVTTATHYYYSGVPGLNNITFVPSSGASGRIAIPYTGYGSGGTSFSGTLYISLDEVDGSTIRYSVEKNGIVDFRASDFYNAGLYRKGIGADYVMFDLTSILQVPDTDTDLGTLYYNYQSSSSYHPKVGAGYYYVSPSTWQNGLNLISFHAASLAGTYTIPYTAVCGAGTSQQTTFPGKVVIQVGAISTADVNISCSTGWYAQMPSYSLSSVCGAGMSASLSYIEITSVPASEEGRLYLGYNGFGTGTAVKPGERFYRIGSPSIDRLFFVPHAGFTGVAEITYIGYSGDGKEQVSGRVLVNVSQSATSRYFNDMSGHKWAIDSVDYLNWNGTVKGTGNGGFGPGLTVSRGDFTLMLVRAYGFTASGSASFRDVPADSYYADAIRVAYLLGVVSGYNGNFSPKGSLTRQDAAVIIYNALKASGKETTNGLAANLDGYHDERAIASYAREAMGSLVQMGILKGNGKGYLEPQRQLTRAEAAMLLHTIMTL